MWRDLYKTIH